MQAGAIMILPSYVEAVGELPAKERGEMWRAIIEYATQGAHPALKTPTQRAVFAAIKPSLDYNAGRRKMPTSCRQNADIMQASCGQDDGTPSKEMKKRRKEEMSRVPPPPKSEECAAQQGSQRPCSHRRAALCPLLALPPPLELDTEQENKTYLLEQRPTWPLRTRLGWGMR